MPFASRFTVETLHPKNQKKMSKRMNPKMVPNQKMTKRKTTKRKKQSKVLRHSAYINEDKYYEPK